MTKKYQVTFNSGDENSFRVHIGDNNVKFPYNSDGVYLSKPDNNVLGNWLRIKKEYYLRRKQFVNHGGKQEEF